MKITLTIDRRRLHVDGTFPVCVKFTNINTAALYVTPYRVTPSQWRGGRVVNHDRAHDMNHRLHQLLLQCNEVAERVCGFVNKLPATIIRDRVRKVVEGEESAFVLPIYNRYMKMKDRPSTIDSFTYTRATLQKYCNLDALTFDMISVDWLAQFERWLLRRVKRNTCAIHLENLRAVVNYAVAEELTTTYSFKRFRIKREASAHRCLTLDDMRKVWRLQPTDPYKMWYLDIFRLSFALCGLNIVDIFNLTADNIVNGRLEVNRQKTGVRLSIALTDEARALLDRLRGKKRLVNIADRYTNHKDFLSRCNRGLSALWPNLTTYYARHTWATIAAELGVPVEVIGLGLGHRVGSAVTNIYIRHDLRRLDEANRMILDAVCQ